MKKILIISIFSATILASCDYESNPYPEKNGNSADTTSCASPAFPAVTSHIKKILIEDFTGHTCGNCPHAATELHEIDSLYPGQIVGMAMHVGSFAAPTPGYSGSPSTAFTADYRTTVGDEYDATFGASDFGLPQGMFNRKDYDAVTQTHLKFYPNWKAYAASIVSEPSVVDLQLISDFDASTRKICCSVRDSFLTTLTDTLKMVVLLTQDSIIDWQDYMGVNMSNYVHRHMLRDAITPSGAWGESLASGAIPSGTMHIKKFAYTIPDAYKSIPCVANHCHLIAFIYKVRTYEIIQVEEIKLTP
ncbi:MAG: Omp28-related outer membrane protein [Bacteroidetes bacterium]|nr:Omp28-related outer membrane protein [Bacteroidota bacterium]